MPPVSVARRGLASSGGRSTRSGPRLAFGLVAAATHLAAIAAICLMAPPGPLPPPSELAVPMVFEAPGPLPEPPIPTQTLATIALPTPSMDVATDLAGLAPLALQAAPQQRPPSAAPHRAWPHRTPPAALPALSPVAATVPPRAGASAPVGAPAPPLALSGQTSRGLTAWEARVRQAIQNGLVYPAAARLMHREGRTQIRFDYDHGAVEHVAVARPSLMAPLDRAAMEAVMRAPLPAPPAEIAAQRRTMLVWVNFTLTDGD